MKERLRCQALALGFDACGFTSAAAPETARFFLRWLEKGFHGEMGYLPRQADKRSNPQLILPGAQSIIMLLAGYLVQNEPEPNPAGAIDNAFFPAQFARYARCADYHHVLGEKLGLLCQWLSRLGGPEIRSLWYVDTGPILERDLAQRAGLGFVGKHTNLINPSCGNWGFLAAILTTLVLPPDEPVKGRCGKCRRCLDVCPTQAITAPWQLDARRCLAYLTIEFKGSIPREFRPALGNRVFGCDDCLEVCPWNRWVQQGRLMKDHYRHDLANADLLSLLVLTEDDFKARFSGTPVCRLKRRGLLRNVCVALGNTGDARALTALAHAAQDPEPLIAEPAAWAIERIRQRLGMAPN